MSTKPPIDFREWVKHDQQQQDRQWVDSQKRQDAQIEALAMALRQYGVLIDALRDASGLAPEEWEATVNRAIDRVTFSELMGQAPAHETIPAE